MTTSTAAAVRGSGGRPAHHPTLTLELRVTETTPPYRYLDGDGFCLSARLLPDLNAGGVTDTLSITVEGSDEPQSVHVPVADVAAVSAGIVAAAGQQSAATVSTSAPTDETAPPATFVLWLDASDGSVPTHDGIVWPDGTTTVHHRHFKYTATHTSPEMARQLTHGKQGRIAWPAPADRGAIRTGVAELVRAMADEHPTNAAWVQDCQHIADRIAAVSGSGRVADETQADAPAALSAELLPAWEAVYEPGNVSNYLIGYANDQDVATGAAEAWLRSQAEVTGRLEWVSEEQLATGRYDRWFELIERHGDGIDTGPGVIVRRRVEPAVLSQPERQTPPPVGYSGKGRVWCLTCPRPDGEDVPVTVDEVDHWEECARCGRHVVDVAEAVASQPDGKA